MVALQVARAHHSSTGSGRALLPHESSRLGTPLVETAGYCLPPTMGSELCSAETASRLPKAFPRRLNDWIDVMAEHETEFTLRDGSGANRIASVVLAPGLLAWKDPYGNLTEMQPETIAGIRIRCGGRDPFAFAGGIMVVLSPFEVMAFACTDRRFRMDLGIRSLYSPALWGLGLIGVLLTAVIAWLCVQVARQNASRLKIGIDGSHAHIRHREPTCVWRNWVDEVVSSPDEVMGAFEEWAERNHVRCEIRDLRKP